MRLMSILLLFFANFSSFSQKIDNTASFGEISSDTYVRFNYDNDLFVGQDENYTQGFSLEFVAPILSKNPINRILPHLKNDKRTAGIVLEQNAFTPQDYAALNIQQNDRPFAASALLKSFIISKNMTKRQRIASYVSLGIMGPAALGKEIQSGIHKITGSTLPLGWGNQIANHFVFDYGIDYEKELIRLGNYFLVNANASIQLGNLNTNVAIGFNTNFGFLNELYSDEKPRKFHVSVFLQPLVRFIGYDAALQGDLIGTKSVYTIPSRNINRLVGQLNYGIVLQTTRFYLEYGGSFLSKEINTLSSAGWGTVKVGFHLR